MSNFIWNNTALEAVKSNLNPLPGGADPTKWVQSSDWNGHRQALLDTQTALRFGLFNVKNYGAVGDGVTDDSAAVQAALTDAQNFHTIVGFSTQPYGTLYFPRGNYAMTTQPTLYVTKPLAIQGESMESVIISPPNGTNFNYQPCIYAYPACTLPLVQSLATGPGQAISFNGSPTSDFYMCLRNWIPGLNMGALGAFCVRFFIKVGTSPSSITNLLSSFYNVGGNQGLSSAFSLALNGTTLSGSITTTGGAPVITSGTAVNTGTIYHVALTFDGATTRLFLAGNLVASTAQSGTTTQANIENIFLGSQRLGFYGGFNNVNAPIAIMDSVEMRNTATYTSAFTPPTAKHTADANTMFLLNFDSTNGNLVNAETANYGRVACPIEQATPSGGSVNPVMTVRDISITGYGTGIAWALAPRTRVDRVLLNTRQGIVNSNQSFSSRISRVYLNAFGTDPRGGLVFTNQPFDNSVDDFVSTGFEAPISMESGTAVKIRNGYAVGGTYNANAAAMAVSSFRDVWFSNEGQGGVHTSNVSVSDSQLIFDGCNFEPIGVIPCASLSSASQVDVQFNSCRFSTTAASAVTFTDNTNNKHVVGMGNVFFNAPTTFTPTGAVGTNSYVTELTRTGGLVTKGPAGLSSTDTVSKNLNGQVTVSGASTTATFIFGTAETDANYRLSLTPVSSTGTPAAGSNRVLSVSKLGASFTVTVEAAPGVGNTVVFDWHLLR